MVDMNVIKIDGDEYIILDEIKNGKTMYIYLSNSNNPKDFFVRKVLEDNKEELVNLDNQDEFALSMKLFNDKHGKDFL